MEPPDDMEPCAGDRWKILVPRKEGQPLGLAQLGEETVIVGDLSEGVALRAFNEQKPLHAAKFCRTPS